MWQYYDVLDKNLAQVTKSGGAAGRMAVSGETPIGVALGYEVEVAKKQGAGIDVIYPSDGIAWTFEGNAIVKGAKNPQNARRFLDWAVSKSAMAAYAEWRGGPGRPPPPPPGGPPPPRGHPSPPPIPVDPRPAPQQPATATRLRRIWTSP